MEHQMKLLIALQDCDTRIGDIRTQKEEGPKKVRMLEQHLLAVETQLAEEIEQVEAFMRDRRQTEQGIEDIERGLKKANIKLSNIKSNKEYQAALKEIDDLEKDKSLLEDKAIEMMEQAEALETKCDANRENAAEVKRQFEIDSDKITRKLETLDQDLDALEKERARFSRAVDTVLLTRYDSLRGRKGGIAVSPVVKGVCQTCHLRIPPQEFNELIRGDKLMTCPNCLRIIYWGEDERYQNKENA